MVRPIDGHRDLHPELIEKCPNLVAFAKRFEALPTFRKPTLPVRSFAAPPALTLCSQHNNTMASFGATVVNHAKRKHD
jgi:hypothetical protein